MSNTMLFRLLRHSAFRQLADYVANKPDGTYSLPIKFHITLNMVRNAYAISSLSILIVKNSFFTEVISARLPKIPTSISNGRYSLGIKRIFLYGPATRAAYSL